MKSGEVKLFVGICVVALLLVGVAVYPMLSQKPPPVEDGPPVPVKLTRAQLVPAWSRAEGDSKAPYTLVEFGDYQCAGCATAKFTVRELLEKYKGKINHVYHHMQVMPNHNWAPMLARAAEAAGNQGKFWEFHAAIYENQARFKDADEQGVMEGVTDLAKNLKLDIVKFRSDMNKPESAEKVSQMQRLAQELRLETTPFYYLVPNKGEVTQIGTTRNLEDFLAKPDTLK